MQERLSAAGLRPINNVVDVTNYVMLEYGQPLHAFDAKQIGGGQIVVRRAAEGEKLVTLDGKERLLSSRMLVIADTHQPLVVAGIMGGERSGVSADTTDIVLEAAHFRRQSIRWASKRLGLASDSSYRFERGVDPHSALEAAYRALDLLVATAGGRIVGPICQVGGDKPWQREVAVTPAYIRAKVGFEIADAEMRAALEALDLNVVREEALPEGGVRWTVAIPSWRDDLDRPIDLVEEVLRLYGTDRIPAAVVQAPGLLADDDPVVLYHRHATDYLVGHDFHECVNTTLRPAKELAAWVSPTAAAELALANPFVEDQSHLRPTLLSGLLESLKLNRSRGVAASRLFETGRIFVERDGQNFECVAVAFIVAEDAERRWLKREPADFYSVKHHVEALAAAAGLDLARQPPASGGSEPAGWQAGHSAVSGELQHGWLARYGLLDLALIKSLGLDGKIYGGIFAILPEKLAAAGAHRRFAPFGLFPATLRDLALVVDAHAPAEEVRKQLAKTARAAVGHAFAVESVTVFDVYEGQGLPEGKKSLAFALVFRSAERTLTDDEVNAVFAQIQMSIEKTSGWAVRK
jgi:phenylalanyl-tRNA synthetase beta chain